MNMKFGKGITRRVLSLLLVLVMCLGMLPGTAFAAGAFDAMTDAGATDDMTDISDTSPNSISTVEKFSGTATFDSDGETVVGSSTRAWPHDGRFAMMLRDAEEKVTVTASWAGEYPYLSAAGNKAVFDFVRNSNKNDPNNGIRCMISIEVTVQEDIPAGMFRLEISKFGSSLGLNTRIDMAALNTSLHSISDLLSYSPVGSNACFINNSTLQIGQHFVFFVPFICNTAAHDIPNGTTSTETVRAYCDNNLVVTNTLNWELKSSVQSLNLYMGPGDAHLMYYDNEFYTGYRDFYIEHWTSKLEDNFGITRNDFNTIIEGKKYGLFCINAGTWIQATENFSGSMEFILPVGTEFVKDHAYKADGGSYNFFRVTDHHLDADDRLIVTASRQADQIGWEGYGETPRRMVVCFLVKCPIENILTDRDTIEFDVDATARIVSVSTGKTLTKTKHHTCSRLWGTNIGNGVLYELAAYMMHGGYAGSAAKLYCGIDQPVGSGFRYNSIMHNSRRSDFDAEGDLTFYTHEMMMDFVMVDDSINGDMLQLGPGDYYIKSFRFNVEDGLMAHDSSNDTLVEYDKHIPYDTSEKYVSVYVVTSENPNSWVLYDSYPLESVLNKNKADDGTISKQVVFDRDDVIRVKVVNPWSWGDSLIGLDMHDGDIILKANGPVLGSVVDSLMQSNSVSSVTGYSWVAMLARDSDGRPLNLVDSSWTMHMAGDLLHEFDKTFYANEGCGENCYIQRTVDMWGEYYSHFNVKKETPELIDSESGRIDEYAFVTCRDSKGDVTTSGMASSIRLHHMLGIRYGDFTKDDLDKLNEMSVYTTMMELFKCRNAQVRITFPDNLLVSNVFGDQGCVLSDISETIKPNGKKELSFAVYCPELIFDEMDSYGRPIPTRILYDLGVDFAMSSGAIALGAYAFDLDVQFFTDSGDLIELSSIDPISYSAKWMTLRDSTVHVSKSVNTKSTGIMSGATLLASGDSVQWNRDVSVAENTYEYMLTYSVMNEQTSNVVLFDSIERNQPWRGSLQKIELDAIGQGLSANIYVNEKQIDPAAYVDAVITEEALQTGYDGWQLVSDPNFDYSNVKSIAVRFGDTVFSNSDDAKPSSVQVYLKMAAPDIASLSLEYGDNKITNQAFFTDKLQNSENARTILTNSANVNWAMSCITVDKKLVSSGGADFAASTTITEDGQVYSYRLSYELAGGKQAQNVILYDEIENGTPSRFAGTVTGVDLTDYGDIPVQVYVQGIGADTTVPEAFSELPGDWKRIDPDTFTDWADVTHVAFYSGDYVFDSKDRLSVYADILMASNLDTKNKPIADTSAGVSIMFGPDCQTESVNYDYVEIYYQLDGQYYKAGRWGGSDLKDKVVNLPSKDFWLYWRTDGSSCSYYGFDVVSVDAYDGDDVVTGTVATLPGHSAEDAPDAAALTSAFDSGHPHGNYGNSVNKLWRYTGTVNASLSRTIPNDMKVVFSVPGITGYHTEDVTGTVISVTYDAPEPVIDQLEFPKTGGPGTESYIILGSTTALLAALLLADRKKRR